jgi:hypothetical protein
MTTDPTTTASDASAKVALKWHPLPWRYHRTQKSIVDACGMWVLTPRLYPPELGEFIVAAVNASPAPAAEPASAREHKCSECGKTGFVCGHCGDTFCDYHYDLHAAAPPAPAPPEEVERRLGEIEAREKAATKGPWQNYYNRHAVFQSLAPYPQTDRVRDVAQVQTHDDGDFIAHARQDIPWLVAQLRARLASPASPATREGE